MSKKKNYYLNNDGERLSQRMTNRHHCAWPQPNYIGPHMRNRENRQLMADYRGMPGFLVRMTIDSHADLHAALDPPIKPSDDLMRNLVMSQRGHEEDDPYRNLDRIITHLGLIVVRGEFEVESEQLLGNLILQREFVREGAVSLIED